MSDVDIVSDAETVRLRVLDMVMVSVGVDVLESDRLNTADALDVTVGVGTKGIVGVTVRLEDVVEETESDGERDIVCDLDNVNVVLKLLLSDVERIAETVRVPIRLWVLVFVGVRTREGEGVAEAVGDLSDALTVFDRLEEPESDNDVESVADNDHVNVRLRLRDAEAVLVTVDW